MGPARGKGRTIGALVRKTLTVALCACLALMCVPAVALGDDDSTTVSGTVDCGDGWVLAYEATDGEATITGVDDTSTGTGQLTIPDEIALDDGTSATVTAFSNEAFRSSTALTGVTLPSGLEAIPNRAFQDCTGLTSISFPASVAYISSNAFNGCTALASVTFEGDSLEFIGFQAFYGCTSLTSIDIPPLSGGSTSYRYTNGSTSTDYYRLGLKCFYDCSSLSTVTLLPGADGSAYVNDSNVEIFDGTASDFKIICYVPGFTTGERHAYETTIFFSKPVYYAVSFYEDEETATSDTYGTEAVYQAVYYRGTTVASIAGGTAEAYSSTGELPDLPNGYVWAATDSSLNAESSTVTDCVHLYPVNAADLDYAYVSVPNTVYLVNGMQDLSSVAVCTPDGNALDESVYTLVYLKVETTDSGTTYTQVDPTEAWETGTYMVYADGTGDYADTSTGTTDTASPTGKTGTSFTVSNYTIGVSGYTSATSHLGNVALANQDMIDATPAYMVVADQNDAHACLLASWLAGVGGGQAVFTDGDDTNAYVYSAIAASGTGKIYVVGGEDAVGEDVIDRIEVNLTSKVGDISSIGEGAEDAEALALAVYESMDSVSSSLGYEIGDVAIVTSSEYSLDSLAAAQYAYAANAPIFYAGEDGEVSDEVLADLASGGFSKIVVVGPTSYVSSDSLTAIKSSTSATVVRVGNATSAYEASLDIQDLVDADLAVSDGSRIVLAYADEAATVVAAAQYAVLSGAQLVVVDSSSDVKSLVELLGAQDEGTVSSAVLIGDFTDIDDALAAAGSSSTSDLLSTVWEVEADTDLVAGDTYEEGGIVYRVGSSTTYAVDVLEDGLLSTVSYPDLAEGKWYTDAVAFCTLLSVMTGYDDGTFGVSDTMTRAQLAAIMWRIAEPEEAAAYEADGAANTTGMSDVKAGAWYTGAANWAVEAGVINGKEASDGTRYFDPTGTVTFQELCAVLANYIDSEGRDAIGDDEAAEALSAFTDASSVSSWAAASVAWCVSSGLVNGNDDGTLAPKTKVKRVRTATVIKNAMDEGQLAIG